MEAWARHEQGRIRADLAMNPILLKLDGPPVIASVGALEPGEAASAAPPGYVTKLAGPSAKRQVAGALREQRQSVRPLYPMMTGTLVGWL
jgi:hypothetical protein